MTKELFEKLDRIEEEKEKIITVADLEPYVHNQTLLYGFTCERKTFHTYVKNGEIYVVAYDIDFSTPERRPKNMQRLTVRSNYDYVPDKRLYPERCEYLFCRMLKEKGVHLPFTTWNDDVDNSRKYYGFTLEDVE
jgi:hypothetical protein